MRTMKKLDCLKRLEYFFPLPLAACCVSVKSKCHCHKYPFLLENSIFQCYYCPQTKFAKVMFLHVSVILSTGWGSPGTYPEGRLRGLAWGVSRPYPGGRLRGLARGILQAHTQGGGWGVWPGGCLQAQGGSRPRQGGASQHALRQTTPSRRLLLRTVCILLEYILVFGNFMTGLSPFTS